jgi:hypothetical protein
MLLVSSFQVMGVVEENREHLALAGMQGGVTSKEYNHLSEAGLESPDKLTRFSCPSSASFSAMTVFSPCCTTGTVRVDHRSLSI